MKKVRWDRLGLDRFSGLYLWAIFFVVFSIEVPNLFLTTGTLHSVASDKAIVGMLALGLLVPMAAGAYDLSIGAGINFAAVVVAVLQSSAGWGMWPAIGATVALGAFIGVVNGFLVVKLGVNSFIGTLGTATVITAFQSIVSGQSQPLPPTSRAWSLLASRQVFGFQIVVLYMLLLACVAWWFLDHTPAGRYLYAIGGNSEAARLSGVRVGMWTWISFVISGTVAAIAGVFYCSIAGPSLSFGQALLLPAFAAVFLGSTQLRAGRFNVWGTLLAIYVLATGVKGLQLLTGVQWLDDMFNGVALVAAVAFSVWGTRRARQNELNERASAVVPDPAVDPQIITGDIPEGELAASRRSSVPGANDQ